MKLFVWNDPYSFSYGGACAYAIAETVEQARELVKGARVQRYGQYGGEVAPANIDVSGEPTRVCDLPYAEIYEWEE